MELIINVTDNEGCIMTDGTFIPLNHRIIYDGHYFYGVDNLIRYMPNAYQFLEMIRMNVNGNFGRYHWKWESMTTSKSGTVKFGEQNE